MSAYAIKGPVTGELLSYRGRVILHDNRAEMEWLFPNAQIVPVNGRLRDATMRLRDHPDMAEYRWPLRREDFA